MSANPQDDLIDVNQARDRFNLTKQTLYRLVNNKDIPSQRIDRRGRVLINAADLQRLLIESGRLPAEVAA